MSYAIAIYQLAPHDVHQAPYDIHPSRAAASLDNMTKLLAASVD